MGLSNHGSQWIHFPAPSIPTKTPSNNCTLPRTSSARARPVTLDQCRYVIDLCHHTPGGPTTTSKPAAELDPSDSTPTSAQATASAVTPRRKFACVQDVQENRFYDLVGQVLKVFDVGAGKFQIYLTDYTSNDRLYRYEWAVERAGPGRPSGRDGDEFGYLPARSAGRDWPGPYGTMTLQVLLFEPHASYAQNQVKEGDYVSLRNVRIRRDRVDADRLDGVLHTDHRYPNLVGVDVLRDHTDDRVKAVMIRKREYWKRAKRERNDLIDVARKQKRKRPSAVVVTEPDWAERHPRGKRSEPDTGTDTPKVKEREEEVDRQEPAKKRASITTKPKWNQELNKYGTCRYIL